MDERCGQNDTGSKVFANEEYYAWEEKVGGARRDIRERYGYIPFGSTLPGTKGK